MMGASQFFEWWNPDDWERGEREELMPSAIAPKVPSHIKASSPLRLQNWLGRLKRYWYWRQVDFMALRPRGSTTFGLGVAESTAVAFKVVGSAINEFTDAPAKLIKQGAQVLDDRHPVAARTRRIPFAGWLRIPVRC